MGVNNWSTGTISYTIKATWSGSGSPKQGVDAVDFDGDGKTMKHIEIGKLQDIDEKRIVKLLRLVKKS